MIHLGEALPVTGRAASLRTTFNHSLIESVKYLLSACVEVIPSEHYSEASRKLDALKPDLKLSGLLSIIHTDFVRAVEQEDLQKVKIIGERLSKDTYQQQDMTYLTLSDLNDYYHPFIETTLVYDRPEKISFLPVSSEEREVAANSIQPVLKIYEEAFPDFFEEFQALVSQITILNCQVMRAGSSFDIYGMIFLCYDGKWKNKVTDILDLIVHEQSHLYVYLLAKDDSLVLNPTERYEAPLRKEKRPLMGIYHAVYVLSRIQYVLEKALSYNLIPESEITYCQESIDHYRKRFHIGLDILKKHAQMTPLAEALITSASKLL